MKNLILLLALSFSMISLAQTGSAEALSENEDTGDLMNSASSEGTDITVEELYANYLAFIDPENSFGNITSITTEEVGRSVTEMSGTTTESNMVMLSYRDIQGRVVSVMKMPTINTKTVFDGTSGYTELSTGFKQDLTEEMINIFKQNNGLLIEEQRIQEGTTLTKDVLDGSEVYVVDYIYKMSGSESKITNYYLADSFKKIRSIIQSETNGITARTVTIYEDYQEFQGIKQPRKTIMLSTTSSAAFNSNVRKEAELEYNFNEDFSSYSGGSLNTIASNIASIPSGGVSQSVNTSSAAIASTVSSDTNTATSSTTTSNISEIPLDSPEFESLNKREQAYRLMLENNSGDGSGATTNYSAIASTVESAEGRERITRMEAANAGKLKYRRSSLYTLMLDDNTREHFNVIKDAFGNTELSEKFNDHNIGPYLVPAHGVSGEDDQTQLIENYLNANGVARNLVAKWFNRDEKGQFNMNLIAERGQYNASEIDVKIAKSSLRGQALLADAGSELIGNTFVVIYDYKYTNKEEQAKKRKGWLSAVSVVASLAGVDEVSTVADAASLGSDVMGKGYFVRTASYLYRLVWNEEVADEFFNNLWMDESDYDPAKKEAFDRSDLFKLEYVGSELSRNNLQSTIFTSKSNEQLIEIATTRAVDKNIGKLQRSYEEFRVKTPLLSIDPIAAKIGLKEDIEGGDKFEVLEQILNEDGTTEYEKVGVIKVDGKQIWDNTYLSDEAGESEGPAYTVFKGRSKNLAPGMLIRQIN